MTLRRQPTPQAELFGDARTIDEATVLVWALKYPHAEEFHLRGGFPCVDLSTVRFGRKNLAGPQSGLPSEILRVLELIRKVFGRRFRVLFFIENVASMDRSAALRTSVKHWVFYPTGFSAQMRSSVETPVLLDKPGASSSRWHLCRATRVLYIH